MAEIFLRQTLQVLWLICLPNTFVFALTPTVPGFFKKTKNFFRSPTNTINGNDDKNECYYYRSKCKIVMIHQDSCLLFTI